MRLPKVGTTKNIEKKKINVNLFHGIFTSRMCHAWRSNMFQGKFTCVDQSQLIILTPISDEQCSKGLQFSDQINGHEHLEHKVRAIIVVFNIQALSIKRTTVRTTNFNNLVLLLVGDVHALVVR